MKTGRTLLSLTVLSLGVYRFSQTFLVQQVQRVEAATVVDQKAATKPLTGSELNITVKNYPAKTVQPDPTPDLDGPPNTNEATRETTTNDEQTNNKTQETQSTRPNQTPTFSVPLADLLQAAQLAPKQATKEAPQLVVSDQAAPKPTQSKANHKAKATKQTATNHQFQKHHAQVEKDIVAFQSSSSTPAPGGGGAATQVGAVFGELAGRSLFAVRK